MIKRDAWKAESTQPQALPFSRKTNVINPLRFSVRSRRAVATVVAGAAIVASVLLAVPASAYTGDYVVTGHVSLGTAGVAAGAGEVLVQLTNTNGDPNPTGGVPTDANGDYRATIPAEYATDEYHWGIHFQYTGTGDYLSPWWTPDAAASGDYAGYVGEAAPLPLSSTGSTVADIVMPHPASVSGTVTASQPGLLSAHEVVLDRTSALSFNHWYNPYYKDDQTWVSLQSDGSYSITGLYPGSYHLTVPANGIGTSTAATHAGATAAQPARDDQVVLAAGQAVTENPYAYAAGYISGTVTCSSACPPAPNNMQRLVIYRQNESGGYSEYRDGMTTAASQVVPGPYFTLPLVPGTYRIQVRTYGPERGSGLSDPIVVQSGQSLTTPITFGVPATTRLWGGDRFATSVAISSNTLDPAHEYSPGVPAVYIASGLNFPDALSAGPAAARQHAPLLLVMPGGIPSPVADELTRLQPQRIVIVGGTASVSSAVESQLAGYVQSPSDIVRLSGGDRYATSRAVAAYAFPNGTTTAYVATGTAFPDALSAGGAAVAKGAPLIILSGTAASADPATIAQLRQLGATNIDIVGGNASVSSGVEASLRGLPGVSVARLAGADRYDTSAVVNGDAFDDADTVSESSDGVPSLTTSKFALLALGTNFPDALAGVALAGNLGMPLYIAPSGCVPQAVLQQLGDEQVQTVVLLGGSAGLAEPVAALASC